MVEIAFAYLLVKDANLTELSLDVEVVDFDVLDMNINLKVFTEVEVLGVVVIFLVKLIETVATEHKRSIKIK